MPGIRTIRIFFRFVQEQEIQLSSRSRKKRGKRKKFKEEQGVAGESGGLRFEVGVGVERSPRLPPLRRRR
jgi:hypothetical protein